MQMLPDSVREQVRERFAEKLIGPVEARLYIRPGSGRLILPSGVGCPTCEDTRQLVIALAELAPEHIQLSVVDVTQAEVGEDVLDVPLLTLGVPGEPHRIRFLGLPAGFEFGMVVEAIERLSAADAELAPESVEAIAELQEPAEILVFTTPTCRYCPAAVSLANRLALASPNVTSITVSANEFQSLSTAFGVQGVPRTVVNRRGAFVGAVPEPAFVDAVLQLAGVRSPEAAQPVQGESSAL
jgi:glutaredoxin-like protein